MHRVTTAVLAVNVLATIAIAVILALLISGQMVTGVPDVRGMQLRLQEACFEGGGAYVRLNADEHLDTGVPLAYRWR